MGREHRDFNDYIKVIPEEYKENILLLEDFKGNRTNISFKFSCGCETKQKLKAFLSRDNFQFCTKCKQDHKEKFICNYCSTSFVKKSHFNNCQEKCKRQYENLVLGEDYVICGICGFHGKSLSNHVSTTHGIDPVEYKKDHQIICKKSIDSYSASAQEQISWIVRAKEEGKDLTEYWQKVSKGVREAIMNNPEDRARRAKVMTKVNQSSVMRKKASDTAKITSARKDIQEKRSFQLKRWRSSNQEDFYNKCTKRMINAFQSKPEKKLLEFLKSIDGFDFQNNQFITSALISTKTNRKQVDIADVNKKIYIEFDGVLHFLPKRGETLLNSIKMKDAQLDRYILENNYIIIRVSYDQFVDKSKTTDHVKYDASYFKPECLEKIKIILSEAKPGIYKIGKAYEKDIDIV